MTLLLYLEDAYLRSTRARVVDGGEKSVILDRTVLYAESGGQMGDQGVLRVGEKTWRVLDSRFREDRSVEHLLDSKGPPVGAEVEVEVDWPRRFGLMRHHTAVHVLSAVVHSRWGGLFTGGQLYPDRARLDVELKNWDPSMLSEMEREVQSVIEKDLPVSHSTISREEYEKGGYSKLRDVRVDPSLQKIRLTIIGDPSHPFDVQADGGTHVRRLREIGRVVLDRSENKGKGHRRLHLHVEPTTL